MHPHRRAAAIGPPDHAFNAAGRHRTGRKLDEVVLDLQRAQFVGTGFIEALLKRVVLQARCTGGLFKPVFPGEDYGLLPEFFGQSGTLVALSATPAIELATCSSRTCRPQLTIPATMNHFMQSCRKDTRLLSGPEGQQW